MESVDKAYSQAKKLIVSLDRLLIDIPGEDSRLENIWDAFNEMVCKYRPLNKKEENK